MYSFEEDYLRRGNDRETKKGVYLLVIDGGIGKNSLKPILRAKETLGCPLYITDEGALKTAPADNMILAGVARGHLISFCREFGIPVIEEPFTVKEMMSAAEVIVTSSGTLCRPVCEIAGVAVGGRAYELLSKLRDALTKDFMDKTE